MVCATFHDSFPANSRFLQVYYAGYAGGSVAFLRQIVHVERQQIQNHLMLFAYFLLLPPTSVKLATSTHFIGAVHN